MSGSGWVVITGASSGIGRAVAELCLERGLGVVVSARTQADLQDAFGGYGPDRVQILPFDFSQVDAIQGYGKEVLNRVGAVRGLVHSAALQETMPINMAKPAEVVRLFTINTFAGIELVRTFSRNKMYDPANSSFVLISSMAAHEGSLGNAIYGASKGALEGFLAPAASELVRRKIRLNVVVPGFVRSRMTTSFTDKVGDEQLEKLRSQYPLDFGEPSDIGQLITFLLCEESRWITGQQFVADGGHSIRF